MGPGGPRVVPRDTGGGEGTHPPWICHVGVLRRVRWIWRRWRQVVRVWGVGLGGPFGVDVVAGRIRFLVGGGRSLVVGGAVGLSAWWVVRPSHALMLLMHGGLWPGGVG